jgi:hypothetical protein
LATTGNKPPRFWGFPRRNWTLNSGLITGGSFKKGVRDQRPGGSNGRIKIFGIRKEELTWKDAIRLNQVLFSPGEAAGGGNCFRRLL